MIPEPPLSDSVCLTASGPFDLNPPIAALMIDRANKSNRWPPDRWRTGPQL